MIVPAPIMTAGGCLVSNRPGLLVRGKRGPYIELDPECLDRLKIPPEEAWRATEDSLAYYVELRTRDGVMVYYQRRPVSYAPYRPGMAYVSPWDVSPCPLAEPEKELEALRGVFVAAYGKSERPELPLRPW